MADQTTDQSQSLPVIPNIPIPPIPVPGSEVALAFWMVGTIAVYGCTPTGQKMAADADAAVATTCNAVHKAFSNMVGHAESFISGIVSKVKGAGQ